MSYENVNLYTCAALGETAKLGLRSKYLYETFEDYWVRAVSSQELEAKQVSQKIVSYLEKSKQNLQAWRQSESFNQEWSALGEEERLYLCFFSNDLFVGLYDLAQKDMPYNTQLYDHAQNYVKAVSHSIDTVAALFPSYITPKDFPDYPTVVERYKFKKLLDKFKSECFPSLEEKTPLEREEQIHMLIWLSVLNRFNTPERNQALVSFQEEIDMDRKKKILSFMTENNYFMQLTKSKMEKFKNFQKYEKKLEPQLQKNALEKELLPLLSSPTSSFKI